MARYKVGQQIVTVGFVFADENYFGVIRRPYRSNMFIGLDTTPVSTCCVRNWCSVIQKPYS